ncbi:Serine_threonine-protein kinase PknD [Streptomyces sp. enrichment culture]|uniref:serine/threonine-protein kinase n=1 Tax=Streptomyces sp. enrichment culture TaxID=1795815 RepID=UPI003F56265E
MQREWTGAVAAVPPGGRIGPYTVLAELASGGMGRVYLARSPGGRTVAVKTLLATADQGPAEADRRRFAREVALARRVRGAFTASVVDADPEAATPWMATEYVAAPSLRELVDSCGPLPADSLHWVAAGMVEALISIHTAGLVHRDVKPSNVLLPEDGPRLIDFGISQATDLTRTKAALGTIPFAAPEQARGEPTTAASDVFSLGATLFHLATGRSPYRGMGEGTAFEQLVRAAEGDLDLGRLPAALDPLIRPCLAVDPAERPTPHALLQMCGEVLARRPEAHGAADWLPAEWADAIERYRRHRTEEADAARLRFDPDAPTERTPPNLAPPVTRHLPGVPRRGRTGLLLGVAAAVLLAGYLVFRAVSDDGGDSTVRGPAQALRLTLVQQSEQGECTDALPPPTFVSVDGEACYSVSTRAEDRMNVSRLRQVSYDMRDGSWLILMTFDDKDARRFAELTARAAKRQQPQNQVAVLLGDRLLSAPAVAEPVSGGAVEIAGDFTEDEARALAKELGGR